MVRNISHNPNGTTNPWAQIAAEIIDKLVGTSTSTTFKFENLEIDSPQIKGPNDVDLGNLKLVVNGKILITTSDPNKE